MTIPLTRSIILASSSPRRQYLMKEAGFTFTVEKPDVEEDFPQDLPTEQVARYLAAKKAEYFRPRMGHEIIITADTVVILGNRILNKPQDRADAVAMLSDLSGRTHRVMTGVCILSQEREETFDDITDVTFVRLSPKEIDFYVDTYKPYDKAGAYGAQDWIGLVAIEKIAGSYFNVMGLPIHKVYQHLATW
ncbi:Maf family nucleotide pyrophosphatase [Parachryseolinea silvisoli]|uniref:Maf family nucleotide pyrophosphatase n=1 Tax=Parachryseolinea silvisoli TaxID=2873601 RepID=UPI0022658CF9|nr:Maf family nucleotide pyrophosphatase [Parachryseolinea silvisoli]MCD9018337.1 Maf family nucleotide pyrophosphatase [Parachryseolinea silvisoli]